MRVLKNLFGDNSKIHASNIVGGEPGKFYEINKAISSPPNQSLSVWLRDYVKTNEYVSFLIDYQTTNLPNNNATEWRYGSGWAINRFNSVLFIFLISRAGTTATRIYRYDNNTWSDWRIFT